MYLKLLFALAALPMSLSAFQLNTFDATAYYGQTVGIDAFIGERIRFTHTNEWSERNFSLLSATGLFLGKKDMSGGFTAGWRYLTPRLTRAFALDASYDVRYSSPSSFEQLTLGLMTRSLFVEWVANAYLPFGSSHTLFSQQHRYPGGFIYKRDTVFEALTTFGLDVRLHLPFERVGGEFRPQFGTYAFNNDLHIYWGIKGALAFAKGEWLKLEMTVTTDQFFKARFQGQATLFIPFSKPCEWLSSLVYETITRPVDRFPAIIARKFDTYYWNW